MTITAKDFLEVRKILGSRALTTKLVEEFDLLALQISSGAIDWQQFANEFNGLRTDFVIDFAGGEFADQLLEFEELAEKQIA